MTQTIYNVVKTGVDINNSPYFHIVGAYTTPDAANSRLQAEREKQHCYDSWIGAAWDAWEEAASTYRSAISEAAQQDNSTLYERLVEEATQTADQAAIAALVAAGGTADAAHEIVVKYDPLHTYDTEADFKVVEVSVEE